MYQWNLVILIDSILWDTLLPEDFAKLFIEENRTIKVWKLIDKYFSLWSKAYISVIAVTIFKG